MSEKLSDLIKYHQQLEKWFSTFNSYADGIDSLCQQPIITQFNKDLGKTDNFKNLIVKLAMIDSDKYELLDIANSKIHETYLQYCRHSTNLYHRNLRMTASEARDHIIPYSEKEKQMVEGIIHKYNSWKYPALEIGPGLGQWTAQMSAASPLYIVDRYSEFLDETINSFSTQIAKNRIRHYQTNPYHYDLSVLPAAQFGFVLAWNVFNFMDITGVQNYIQEVYNLLRPGGVFAFSFNDALTINGAKNIEQDYMCCINKPTVYNAIIDSNYEFIKFGYEFDYWSWAEVRKPGKLESLLLHPPMGEIVDKN